MVAMLYAIELMRRSTDQEPVGLLQPNERSSEKTPKEHPFEEAAQPLKASTKKRGRLRCSKHPIFKKRRRAASLFLALLLALAVGALLYSHNAGWTDTE